MCGETDSQEILLSNLKQVATQQSPSITCSFTYSQNLESENNVISYDINEEGSSFTSYKDFSGGLPILFLQGLP